MQMKNHNFKSRQSRNYVGRHREVQFGERVPTFNKNWDPRRVSILCFMFWRQRDGENPRVQTHSGAILMVSSGLGSQFCGLPIWPRVFPHASSLSGPIHSRPNCVPTVVPGTVTRGAVEAGCSLLSLGQLSSQRPGHACQGGQRQPSPVESQALGPGEAQLQGIWPVKDKEVTRVKRMTGVCNLFSRLSCLERRRQPRGLARESTVSGE